METYLMLNSNQFVKCVLTRFIDLACQIFFAYYMRYKTGITRITMCPLCNVSVENELHFVLCCPALDDLRRQYTQPKYYNYSSDFRLTLLMSTKHEKLCAVWLYICIKH